MRTAGLADSRDAPHAAEVSPAAAASSRRVISIPILAVVCVTTVLSSAASVAGGLVMYVESISSLEDRMRDASANELAALAGEIQRDLRNARVAAARLHRVVYNYVPAGLTDRVMHALVQQSTALELIHEPKLYALGVVAIPQDMENGSPFYAMSWVSPTQTGREYTSGLYAPYLANHSSPDPQYRNWEVDNTTTPPRVVRMGIPSYFVNNETGAQEGYAYTWNAQSYMNDIIPPGYNISSGELPVGTGQWREDPEHGAAAIKHRPPGVWFAESDKTLYAYGTIDVLMAPPPPPHPWSNQRAVIFVTGFLYSVWEDHIVRYKEASNDASTTVVLADIVLEVVYATTTAETVLRSDCTHDFSAISVSSCMLKIGQMSGFVQAAFAGLTSGSEAGGTFQKGAVDGTEYFQRIVRVYEDVVMLWLRPVSAVEGEVEAALVLLVVFTLLVLAFDATIAVAEVMLIAAPLWRVSAAVREVGHWQLNAAGTLLARYDGAGVMVRELWVLVSGLRRTMVYLEAVEGYLPASVFVGDEVAGPDVEADEDTLSQGGSGSASMSFSSRRTSLPVDMISTGTGASEDVARGSSANPLHAQRGSNSTIGAGGMLHTAAVDPQYLRFDLGLSVRRFTVVDIYMRCLPAVAADVVHAHARLLDTVLQCARQTRGVVDGFRGDRICVAMNTHSMCSGHKEMALQCAMLVWQQQQRTAKGGVGIGVSTCTGNVGNMGCDRLKRFNMLSDGVEVARQCATLSSVWCVGVVVPWALASGPGTTAYEYRALHKVVVGRRGFMACEILHSLGTAAEEWMYELDALRRSPYRLLEEALQEMLAGSLEAAAEAVEAARRAGGVEEHVRHMDGVLAECRVRGEPPPAVDMDVAVVKAFGLKGAAEERMSTPGHPRVAPIAQEDRRRVTVVPTPTW